MNGGMLSASFLSLYWALPLYSIPEDAKYLLNSQVPGGLMSPSTKTKVNHFMSFCHLPVLFTGAFRLWAWEHCPTLLPFLENISSGPPAFLYVGLGKETIMKLTELPESRMTSPHVNSLRRWQAEAWRERRKNIHEEKFAFGLPTSFCVVSRMFHRPFRINVFAPNELPWVSFCGAVRLWSVIWSW